MRENGPLHKIRVSESKDDGVTWGPVGTIDLPNPGSGLDGVRLANGHWLLIYNDTVPRSATAWRFRSPRTKGALGPLRAPGEAR